MNRCGLCFVVHDWSQENCRRGPEMPVKPAAPARVGTGVTIQLASLALLVLPSTVVGQTTLRDAIASGRPIVDVRLRFEHVDQSDKPKDAVATTAPISPDLAFACFQFSFKPLPVHEWLATSASHLKALGRRLSKTPL